MKKIIYKIFALILAIVMMLISLSSVSFAGNEPEMPNIPRTDSGYSTEDSTGKYKYFLFENDTVYICNYVGNEEDVVIPSEIDGYKVSIIGYEAFCGNKKIKSVVVPETVTGINECAFKSCEKIESISLPDSIKYIEKEAFDNTAYYNDKDNWENGVLYIDNHLIIADKTEVGGEYTVKARTKVIAAGAFDDCDNLTGVTVIDGVTIIGVSAFANCDELKNVSLPDSLITIDYDAFRDSDNLESIVIPKGVTTINSSAFRHCDNLKEVKLNEDVVEIGYGNFEECNDSFTLYGYSNTVAEAYAKENDITFVSIGTKETKGDTNSDGNVSATDARIVLQAVAGTKDLSDEEKKAADMNGDGNITAVDARYILQVVAGLR